MKESLFYALASALVTAALIFAGPLKAQSVPNETQTYVSVVDTSDLDLGSAAGERKLEQRLAIAAREVCGSASDVDLKGKKAVRACRQEAVANALEQRQERVAAKGGAVIAVTVTR